MVFTQSPSNEMEEIRLFLKTILPAKYLKKGSLFDLKKRVFSIFFQIYRKHYNDEIAFSS